MSLLCYLVLHPFDTNGAATTYSGSQPTQKWDGSNVEGMGSEIHIKRMPRIQKHGIGLLCHVGESCAIKEIPSLIPLNTAIFTSKK